MRKKEGNKERDILDASVSVFSCEGYSNAKMHTIAENAGIASGTIYLYFTNKEEILLKIFESVWENIFRLLDTIDSEENDPICKFHRMIDSVFELFDSKPALATVFVNEQHHIMKRANKLLLSNYQKTLCICENVLTLGIQKHIFKKEIDPLIFSSFFFGGIRYTLQQWALDQKKYNIYKMRETVKSLVLSGILDAKVQ